jgi:hypothetical protein
MWQVELIPDIKPELSEDLFDKLPDIVTTTFQCLVHLITGHYDLAAIPRWRRKRFEIKKTKYFKRNVNDFLKLYGVDTIFNMIGGEDCNFVYVSLFDELIPSLSNLFKNEYRLEFIDVHALDTIQHWNLDNLSKVIKFYQRIDSFINHLHETCIKNGITFILLSDHGQEPVVGSIDILSRLKSLKIPRSEYTYYIEGQKTRLFFHSERAREKILDMLSLTAHGTVLSYTDLHKYNVKFNDASHGEYYFIANPGYIFFPNDFYHPLGNIFLGLKDGQQRSRLKSPKHRGYHGYLPENDSEKGFMILADENFEITKKDANVVDVVPTILSLLWYKQYNGVNGDILFK